MSVNTGATPQMPLPDAAVLGPVPHGTVGLGTAVPLPASHQFWKETVRAEAEDHQLAHRHHGTPAAFRPYVSTTRPRMSPSQLSNERAGLADLPVPPPFTILQLVSSMERVHGGQILVTTQPEHMRVPETSCGLRLSSPGFTRVLFPVQPTSDQTQHAVLHALAHEWYGHGRPLELSLLQTLMPGLGVAMIERFVADGGVNVIAAYDEEEERIAGSAVLELIRKYELASQSRPSGLRNALRRLPAGPFTHLRRAR
ncbi:MULTISPECIES: hypothetical protein [unclassified Streptomyces]|uniref:hypothetical protein n=1 Tax=unclassified Streptomyces TaxID=2593676 RepID=UPI00114CD6BB|nr:MULTISPECIES: hypothetical protein [unclassified Streptomyces]MYZ37357.1 hypothetical protein [Streptomyces sp. SID4917]